MYKIIVLVDNHVMPGLLTEHGFSLLIQINHHTILFDTGAGNALLPNLEALKINPTTFTHLIFSHGHNDHTGGLANLMLKYTLPNIKAYIPKGLTDPCFSNHADGYVHDISMPKADQEALRKIPSQIIDKFTQIEPEFFLTGPIPRQSGEPTGGDFYKDKACAIVHTIDEEQTLLLSNGVLISGCCHAGIINTVEFCKKTHPEIKIHTILGGLHLRRAPESRLKQTADYLNTLNLQRLFLFHCTGDSAAQYLIEHVHCDTQLGKAGDIITE
ncbi:MAG: MBL fold metallo-hydrolase [Lentisphaeria bacterium]